MIFYDKKRIDHLLMIDDLLHWRKQGLLSDEQLAKAAAARQPAYKHTNIFLRAGIFILTVIIVSCGLGFIFLITTFDQDIAPWMTLFFGTATFFVLVRFIIKERNHYQSGLDDALLYYGLSLFLGGVFLLLDLPSGDNYELIVALIIFPFLVLAAISFTDRLLAGAGFVCLIAIIFLLFIKLGDVGKLLMPFLIMGVSLTIYFIIKKHQGKEPLVYWKNCFMIVEWLSLLCFYAAGNYFVVRELSTSFFDIHLETNEDIPLAFLFYAFTVLIPGIYIFFGLKNKDDILLNTGLMLIAAAVATIRYYHSIMPIEGALVLGGLVLMAIAGAAHRYLNTPKSGITKEDTSPEDAGKINLEALIITQTTMPSMPAKEQGMEFGGGEFGGGGAGGNY